MDFRVIAHKKNNIIPWLTRGSEDHQGRGQIATPLVPFCPTLPLCPLFLISLITLIFSTHIAVSCLSLSLVCKRDYSGRQKRKKKQTRSKCSTTTASIFFPLVAFEGHHRGQCTVRVSKA